jgi:hypothetical protein
MIKSLLFACTEIQILQPENRQKHFEHFWKKTLDSGDAGKD